jgi:nucleoside-diphosphate-sugar epimerase
MTNSKPSVLITGANGFVGARMCRRFLDEGFRVIAGVRKSAILIELEGLDVEYRNGDVTQPETLPEMVAGVDYIFFDVNEQGTRSFFDAIAKHNPAVKKVVQISSLAAAGPSLAGRPVRETDEPRPITTYGQSKLAGEKTALSFADKFDVVAIRPPGIYGPGDKEVFSFFQTIRFGIKPYLGNVQRKLQLVHVDDLCRGVFLAATKPIQSPLVLFIAENRAYTMKDLIEALSVACQKDGFELKIPGTLFRAIATVTETLLKVIGAPPMLTREKAGELLASWEVSTDLARDTIGFESQIPFERGARETFEWYLRRGWLK